MADEGDPKLSDNSEEEIESLRAELSRLKRSHAEAVKLASAQSPAELKHVSHELRRLLAEYDALQEDLIAKRLFDKAKKYFIGWITLGGLVISAAAFIGYESVIDYVKDQAKLHVADVVTDEFKAQMLKQGKDQIGAFVTTKNEEFTTYYRAQVASLLSLYPRPTPNSMPTAASNAVPTSLPPSIDLSPDMRPVRDQGSESSGVAFATSAALEYLVKTRSHRTVEISPREIYYYAREQMGTESSDSGATLVSVLSVITTHGAVAESAWPYVPGQFNARPPSPLADAEHFRADGWRHLKTVDDIKGELAKHSPVILGVVLYTSAFQGNTQKTGQIQIPKPDDTVVGGDAFCVVGYDDGTKMFKFRNSWGSGWGDHGYGYIPYNYQTWDDAYALSYEPPNPASKPNGP